MGSACCAKLETHIKIEGLSVQGCFNATSEDIYMLRSTKKSAQCSKEVLQLIKLYTDGRPNKKIMMYIAQFQ